MPSPVSKGLSRTRDGLLVTEIDLNMIQQIKDKWCIQVCVCVCVCACVHACVCVHVHPECVTVIQDPLWEWYNCVTITT